MRASLLSVRFLLAVITVFSARMAAAEFLYWTDFTTDGVHRAQDDGTGATSVVSSLNDPIGVAVDSVGGKLYWAEFTASQVWRANLDGSLPQLVASAGVSLPGDIAVDPAGGKVYWTQVGDNTVRRANLDGTSPETILTGAGQPYGITLDTLAGKVYWTELTFPLIRRANLNGSSPEDVISSGITLPVDVAVDSTSGKVYWLDRTALKIQRANLNGTNVEDIVTGLNVPNALALNVPGDWLYWTDSSDQIIGRARLDGSSVDSGFMTGITNPQGIALGGNIPPTAVSGGPYAINEGDNLVLDGSASMDMDGGINSYDWDLDNDTVYNDATGAMPTVSWFTLDSLGLNDGIHPVALQVSDGFDTATDPTTLTINNLPPGAVSDTAAVDSDVVLTVTAPGVLANDIDPGDDPLMVSSYDTNSALGATVSVQPDGSYTYDPSAVSVIQALTPGQTLVDSFNYTISDGSAMSTATVDVTVTGATPAATPVPLLGGFLCTVLLLASAVVGLSQKTQNPV